VLSVVLRKHRENLLESDVLVEKMKNLVTEAEEAK